MITLPILTTSLIHFSFGRFGECYVPGLQSVRSEPMDRSTLDIVRAGVQLSLRISRQITPYTNEKKYINEHWNGKSVTTHHALQKRKKKNPEKWNGKSVTTPHPLVFVCRLKVHWHDPAQEMTYEELKRVDTKYRSSINYLMRSEMHQAPSYHNLSLPRVINFKFSLHQ